MSTTPVPGAQRLSPQRLAAFSFLFLRIPFLSLGVESGWLVSGNKKNDSVNPQLARDWRLKLMQRRYTAANSSESNMQPSSDRRRHVCHTRSAHDARSSCCRTLTARQWTTQSYVPSSAMRWRTLLVETFSQISSA